MTARVRRTSRAPRPADVTVRAAKRGDLPAVATIELDAFSDPWPASAFREALESGHLYFSVAVDREDVVVGYVIGWFAAGEGEIANIAVAEGARGRGIGGLLLDEALAAARRSGSAMVHLEVRVSNRPAQALYATRAFGLVGRRRNYYREPVEDAIVLRCDLGPAVAGRDSMQKVAPRAAGEGDRDTGSGATSDALSDAAP